MSVQRIVVTDCPNDSEMTRKAYQCAKDGSDQIVLLQLEGGRLLKFVGKVFKIDNNVRKHRYQRYRAEGKIKDGAQGILFVEPENPSCKKGTLYAQYGFTN